MRQDVTSQTLALADRDREIALHEPFQDRIRRTPNSAEIPSGWTFCGPHRREMMRAA
jgi:hypothetical protein